MAADWTGDDQWGSRIWISDATEVVELHHNEHGLELMPPDNHKRLNLAEVHQLILALQRYERWMAP